VASGLDFTQQYSTWMITFYQALQQLKQNRLTKSQFRESMKSMSNPVNPGSWEVASFTNLIRRAEVYIARHYALAK
jgi:hypothetical protein